MLFFACNGESKAEITKKPVTKERLVVLVNRADSAINGILPSADGKDIPEEDYWVTQTLYVNLDKSIKDAKLVLDDVFAGQEQIDAATSRLNNSLILFTGAIKPGSLVKNLITAGLGYAKNTINTVPFRQNSLVTEGNTQYISYINGDGNLMLGKRALEDHEFNMKDTGIAAWPSDAHNNSSIMTDAEGYLHVSLNHHNSALNYYRSDEPGSLNVVRQSMIGSNEDSVTYTEFYRLPAGDLLFVYRNGSSGSGDMVLNRYTTATQTWSRIHTRVIYGNGTSPYWQMYLDVKGTIHLSWVFRRTSDVGTNYNMYYAYSTDQGASWRKISDHSAYVMPITPSNAEAAWIIPENSNLMNQTSMTADQEGNPFIATYFGNPVNYQVIYHDGANWHCSQVGNRTGNFSLSGGGTLQAPIARPRLATKYDDESKKTKAYFIFRDTERGSKVSLYTTDDIASEKPWSVRDLTAFSVGDWEPSHDTEIWKNRGKLHIFVQYADQVSGEGLSGQEPRQVYCLEAELD